MAGSQDVTIQNGNREEIPFYAVGFFMILIGVFCFSMGLILPHG